MTELESIKAGKAKSARGHLLQVGNKALHVPQTRDVLNMFRNLAGGGICAEEFPHHLQNLSQQLFDDPQAIDVGAPLEYRRPDGQLVLAAYVGSGVLSSFVEMALC